MREATLLTLKALYDGKEVTAKSAIELKTTRVTNEILAIRDQLNIKVNTVRVDLDNGKWYGRYELDRSQENLDKARLTLDTFLGDRA